MDVKVVKRRNAVGAVDAGVVGNVIVGDGMLKVVKHCRGRGRGLGLQIQIGFVDFCGSLETRLKVRLIKRRKNGEML